MPDTLPSLRGGPDPGSRSAAAVAFVLATLFFLAVAGMQAASAISQSDDEEPPSEVITPEPGYYLLSSKILVAAHDMLGKTPAGLERSEPESYADHVRAAIITAQIDGAPEGLDALLILNEAFEDLNAEAADLEAKGETPEHPKVPAQLFTDIALLQRLYAQGSADLTELERAGLIERHGWFAELALTFDAPATDPERSSIISEGRRAILLLAGAVSIAAIGLIVGLVILIIGLVRFNSIRAARRFIPPSPGGSVYLETFAVFTGAFLALQLVLSLLAAIGLDESVLLWAGLLAQWGLLIVPFWGCLRGVPLATLRAHLGLYRGAGILREAFCGVAGYLAGLPFLAIAFVITFLLVGLWERMTGKAPTPNNPVMETAASGGLAVQVLIFTLATIWAPLAEEAIFRGGLYRHVRSRLGVAAAVVFTGTMFSMMHAYGPAFMMPLIVLGITFALLREWRGSLIASITAHALHNTTLLLFALALNDVMS